MTVLFADHPVIGKSFGDASCDVRFDLAIGLADEAAVGLSFSARVVYEREGEFSRGAQRFFDELSHLFSILILAERSPASDQGRNYTSLNRTSVRENPLAGDFLLPSDNWRHILNVSSRTHFISSFIIKASFVKSQSLPKRALYDYTKGSVGWGITRLSAPMCVEQVVRNFDSVLEVFWIGQLGPKYLAASSLGFMTVLFLRSFGFGIRVSGQALVAQRIGAADSEGASVYAGQSLFVLGIYSLVFSIGGFILSPFIMGLMTSDSEIARIGTIYIRAGFSVFVVWEGMFMMSQILRGAGEPGYTLIAMVLGSCVSIMAVPLLIFGGGPIPALGIAGGFLGLGTGRLTGMIVMTMVISKGHSRVKLRWADLWPRPEIILRMVSLAWPVSVQNLLERGANLILLRLLSTFGAFALAAWTIGNRITLLGRMPSFGFQSSVRTLVGQNLGAGLPERAISAVRLSLTALGILMGVVTISLSLYAEDLVGLFGLKNEAASVGAMALRILSAGILMESVRRVVAGAFHGAARSKPPMVVEGVVRWGVQLPAAFLMAYPLGVGAASIWIAIAGSQIISGSALIIWFFTWTSRGGLRGRGR
jgi:putative MATE family efflux protein